MSISFDHTYIDAAGQDELRLSDSFDVVLQHWRTIVLCVAVSALAGAAIAVVQPPVYQANAMIQVDDARNENGGGADGNRSALQSITGLFDSKSPTNAQIELIRSRLVVEEAVQRMHLEIGAVPRRFPVLGGAVARYWRGQGVAQPPFGLDWLDKYAWGGEQIRVVRFDVPEALTGKPFTLRLLGNGAYALNGPGGREVLTGHIGQTANGTIAAGDISLTIDMLAGRPGTEFVLTRAPTIDTVERLQRALGVTETAVQSGIIGLSYEGTDGVLAAGIVNSIARQFMQQDIDRKSAEAEHTLAFLDQQLPQLRDELDHAEQSYNSFRNRNGAVDLSQESQLLLQSMSNNNAKLTDLEEQRAAMSQRFTESHPTVTALDAQIAALRAQQGSLAHSVSALPDTEQTALRLQRDMRVDTELYTNLLNSAQQLRIIKAGQIGGVRVVDWAVPPDRPVRPKPALLVGIAGLAGLLLGIVIAYTRKTLYGGVQTPQEIERALHLPVCAVVPRSRRQISVQHALRARRPGAHVLALQAPGDVAVEGVRILRTMLQNAVGTAPNNVVMLTGPRPDDGKSFLSVNLSTLVASANRRVLLIDGDMRRGDLHKHFGIRPGPGFADVLNGAEFRECVVRDILPGLDVLCKGELLPNPSELLSGDALPTLIERCSHAYDLVVIDTPPVLAVTDAALIGRHAGTTLMVIRHDRHSVTEIAEAVKRLSTAGVAVAGVLLTDVPNPRAYQRGSRPGYYTYDAVAD